MEALHLRELKLEDEALFLSAMERSKELHNPWMQAPLTHEEFIEFFKRFSQPTHKSFLLCNAANEIIGVFNISEMVRGNFQSAYLGFSSVAGYASRGYMSQGLKLLLAAVFTELKLHRLEANIQPANERSIHLVSKNGFRKEGYSPRYLKINNEWRDCERWAITIEDWHQFKNR